MVAQSHDASLEAVATDASTAPVYPVPKIEEAAATSRRQRSFTSILRSLASKLTFSSASILATVATAEEGSVPRQGPPTWEDAIETIFLETLTKAADDYDDDGSLPAELVTLLDMILVDQREGDGHGRVNDTEQESRARDTAFSGEWIEL